MNTERKFVPGMRFLNKNDVIKITALSPSSIDRMVRDGRFPHPYPIGTRRVAWADFEVYEWMNECLKREYVRQPPPEIGAK